MDKVQNMYNRSIFLKYYFEIHLIYKVRYYIQLIFNQFNIMVSHVDIIGRYMRNLRDAA